MNGSSAVIKRPPATPIATALNVILRIFDDKMKITKAVKTRPIVTWSLKKGTLSRKFSTPAIRNGVIMIAEATAIISGDLRNFVKSSNFIFGICKATKGMYSKLLLRP